MSFPKEISKDTYLITSYAEFILCSHYYGRFEVNGNNELLFVQY
jgi:hypothetical protein